MHRALRQTLAFVLSLALLTVPVWAASPAPLAVVTAADLAHISAEQAITGATVFDGDTLSTEMLGSMRVRAGAAQFQLFASSSARVTRTSTGISATLQGGTVALSAANTGAIELHASEARIRPKGNGPTQAQVTLVSARELLVTARRGSLEITVDDETQIAPEGTSYRVLMDPPDPQEPQGAGVKRYGKRPKKGGRNRFIFILLGGIGVATTVGIHEALESPERP